jgi:acetyl esterase/lipase
MPMIRRTYARAAALGVFLALLGDVSFAPAMAQPPAGAGPAAPPGTAGGPGRGGPFGPGRPAGAAVLGMPSLQAKVKYPGDVEGLLDVVYSTPPGYRPLTRDLYHVAGKGAPKPAVLWLHGGGFSAGDPRMGTVLYREWDKVLAKLVARGYVAAAVAYRLDAEAKFPAQIEDVKAAIRWLRANAATYGIDPQRIAVWGESAGGYLATLAGTSCDVKELEGKGGHPEQSSCVQAVVDWYGPADLFRMDSQQPADTPIKHNAPDSPESTLLGCELPKCSQSTIALANPLNYISAKSPPFLIMHGDADVAVPWRQSQELLDALTARGVSAQFVRVPGANHGFAGVSAAQGQVLMAMVDKFLDSNLGARH